MKKQVLFLSILLFSYLSQASVSIIPMPQKCVEKKESLL